MTARATAGVGRGRWRGEPTIRLHAGDTTAAFAPGLGLTGVSLRRGGAEFLATPGGPAALRGGHTLGLPLLAPWANRLAPTDGGYRAAGVRVAVPARGGGLHRDGNGLPIHGLLVGADGWAIGTERSGAGRASFTATRDLDAAVFPFPHRIGVTVTLTDGALRVTTTVTPTGRRSVPVAFGWHPYLRVPGSPRGRWRLVLPAREHLVLDDRGLPTGARSREAAERAPIGRRTFDDLSDVRRSRVLALETDTASVTLRSDPGYPFAQVWVPPGRPFAALEPMVAPTNALVTGGVPVVAPGDAFSATFTLRLEI